MENNIRYKKAKYNNTMLRPKMVSWDITNKCNLSCKHCFNNSGDSSHHNFLLELNYDEQMLLANQIAEIKPAQCCLCGGETLLNENIYNIAEIISSNGFTMVNMVTNGLLLTDSVAKKLKQSGVSHVQISVDGLGWQHDTFRNKAGAFERSIEAIQILKKNKMNVMVSFCPNKMNAGTIDVFVEYMYKTLGVDTIRTMPLLPMGRAASECKELFLNSYETFEYVQKINQLREKYPKVTIEWGDPLEHMFLVLHSKRKYPIIMSISSSGNLTVTPYIPIVLGNVREHSLYEMWNNGYNKIWSNKEILKTIKQVKSIYDLTQFNDEIYIGCESWKNT